MCILSVHTLLKVVGYYDFSVLSMLVMGFQKKVCMGGGVSSIQVFFWDFLNFFNFAKPVSNLLQVGVHWCNHPWSVKSLR